MNNEIVKMWFDGTAEPTNPGNAAGASIIDLANGETIIATVDIGWQSNNRAEYSALIVGLKKIIELGLQDTPLEIYGDSQLVINQMIGKYECRSANLKEYYQEAKSLLAQLGSYKLEWIKRELNTRADAAAREVIKTRNQKQKNTTDLATLKLIVESVKSELPIPNF